PPPGISSPTLSPGDTSPNASISAGLRLASRSTSAAGRAGSATAATMLGEDAVTAIVVFAGSIAQAETPIIAAKAIERIRVLRIGLVLPWPACRQHQAITSGPDGRPQFSPA